MEQLDWIELNSGLPVVSVGHVVVTSYGSGPYHIVEVSGPCCCPEYVRSLDGDESPSEPHFHLVCRGADGKPAWLAGYRLDGTSVWNGDRLALCDLSLLCPTP